MLLFVNNSETPQLRGSKLIPPGDARAVSARDLLPGDTTAGNQAFPRPLDAQATVAPAGPDLPVLLAGNVTGVIKGLVALTDEQLAALLALETDAEKPRKGVLGAVSELQLQRADALTTLDNLLQSLASLPVAQLLELQELHADDETITAALHDEIQVREGAGD